MRLPQLNIIPYAHMNTQQWLGLNHNMRIGDGEWYDEMNLTADSWPMFSQRGRRGVQQIGSGAPQGMLAKDALAVVKGGVLYYNGYATGLDDLTDGEKQMVSMGAYLVIFPDKAYINTQDLSDFGSIEAHWTSNGGSITYEMCRLDGTAYDVPQANVSDTAPEEPDNREYWIDTSSTPHALKQYSTAQGEWIQIETVYVRIGCTGIGAAFREYDSIELTGCAAAASAGAVMQAQIAELNGEKLIYAAGADYIVIVGIIDAIYTQTTGTVNADRSCPDMDYVCEGENRIWGCFYGMRGGVVLNEIYACALGDFRNWRKFMGISTDSYTVSVGSDGAFTGAISFGGYPHFFKEECLHKIYGSMPSNYQMQTMPMRGVMRGCWRSMQIVDEVLYYKARKDVVAFDGSLPAGISEQLGDIQFTGAVAGSIGQKYYLCLKHGDGWQMYVYNTRKGLWHKEDAVHALCFAAVDAELFWLDADTGDLINAGGSQGELEDPVTWMAESGIIGYEYPQQKYLARFNFRMRLGENANAQLYIEYDSSGSWELQGTVQGIDKVRTYMVPVIPRRCDHLRIRLEGVGDVKIFGMDRLLSVGGDGR